MKLQQIKRGRRNERRKVGEKQLSEKRGKKKECREIKYAAAKRGRGPRN